MKNIFTCLFAITLVAGLSAQTFAQESEGGRRNQERAGQRGERGGAGGERGGRGGAGGERGGPGGQQRMDPARMMQAFPVLKALDANGDGELSAKEIKAAAAALRKLDKNEDGKLDASEMRPSFGDVAVKLANRVAEAEAGQGGRGGEAGGDRASAMMDRMMQADKDGDGKISKEEAPERMQAFFGRLDANDDGFIDKSEIEAMAGPSRWRWTWRSWWTRWTWWRSWWTRWTWRSWWPRWRSWRSRWPWW